MKGGLLAPNLVTEMIEAFARGARMNIDLSDAWDYWPVMDRPLEEVRRLYVTVHQWTPAPNAGGRRNWGHGDEAT